MVAQLNAKDNNVIQRRKIKHMKNAQKEISKVGTDQKIDFKQFLTKKFIVETSLSAGSFLAISWVIESTAKWIAKNPTTIVKVAKWGGMWGLIAGIGVVGVVFIIKEYRHIKELEQRFKQGQLKDSEGNVIKTKGRFRTAVGLSLTGVKSVKVEKFINHLLNL